MAFNLVKLNNLIKSKNLSFNFACAWLQFLYLSKFYCVLDPIAFRYVTGIRFSSSDSNASETY